VHVCGMRGGQGMRSWQGRGDGDLGSALATVSSWTDHRNGGFQGGRASERTNERTMIYGGFGECAVLLQYSRSWGHHGFMDTRVRTGHFFWEGSPSRSRTLSHSVVPAAATDGTMRMDVSFDIERC
jgi:hypothetical protein